MSMRTACGFATWPIPAPVSPAAALEAFAATWEQRYPAIVKLWRAHWSEFIPFLAFPPEVVCKCLLTCLFRNSDEALT